MMLANLDTPQLPVRSSPDVVWETDADLRFLDAAISGTGLQGKTIFDLLGRDSADATAGLAAHSEDLRARKPFRGIIHRAVNPDGAAVCFEIDGEPAFSDDGAFRGYRGIARDITRTRVEETKPVFLADHDALTGLLNRMGFQTALAAAMAALKPGVSVAVLLIDLDNFKLINDSMGHPVGDELLRCVAKRLQLCVRHTDALARVDGDEFGVVQVHLAHPEAAAVLAQRIMEKLHEPCEVMGHRLISTATIGIAVAPANGPDPLQLVKNADIAQYQAKQEVPGCWRFYEPTMGTRIQERRAIEAELHEAVARGQFELYYQPFYNVVAQSTCAFEALIRWRHPVRGLMLPDQFIGIAEETGLIVPLGQWILIEACREAATWPPHVSVSVNLSAVQFRGRSPVGDVKEALRRSGLAASRLELEITESVLLHDSEDTLTSLHQLRALGCRIAMDDFGTGYSSLSYLRRFPFDKIKIDRRFIQDLNRRRGGAEIVRAIATLGNSLNLDTTAEGVETHEQFSIVCAEGCTEVQGYLFSEPRPAREIPQMMDCAPEELRFAPGSVAPPQAAPRSLRIDEPPDRNIFCGEAI